MGLKLQNSLSMLNFRKNFSIVKLCVRNCTSKPNDVVIASAVRTPLASFPDQEKSVAPKLITFATEAAIKQAVLPKEVIDGLHIVTNAPLSTVQSELLKKDVVYLSYRDDFEAIRTAIDKLKHGQAKSIVVTGIDKLPSVNLSNQICERLNLAISRGLYDAEIIPVTLRNNHRQMITLTQDEPKALKEDNRYIAIALALTTIENAVSLNVKPLARILNSTHLSRKDNSTLVQQLLAPGEFKVENVHHWEMDSNSLGLDSTCIHTNSIPGIFGSPSSISFALQLLHLVHRLRSKQLGCSIISRIDGSSTAILLDNPNKICDNPPLLTLYTKDPCPLCDILIEELEKSFNNEYRLEKVFIDQKENLRFLRLYRYDIPILFFNGQFLCMHRLNTKLLRRKIEEAMQKS